MALDMASTLVHLVGDLVTALAGLLGTRVGGILDLVRGTVLGMVTGHPERGGRLENSVKFDRESKKEKKGKEENLLGVSVAERFLDVVGDLLGLVNSRLDVSLLEKRRN